MNAVWQQAVRKKMPPPAGPTKASVGKVKLRSFKATHLLCKERNTYMYIYIHMIVYVYLVLLLS